MKLVIRQSADIFATWDLLLRKRYQAHVNVSLPTLVKMAVSEITKDEAKKMLPAKIEKEEAKA